MCRPQFESSRFQIGEICSSTVNKKERLPRATVQFQDKLALQCTAYCRIPGFSRPLSLHCTASTLICRDLTYKEIFCYVHCISSLEIKSRKFLRKSNLNEITFSNSCDIKLFSYTCLAVEFFGRCVNPCQYVFSENDILHF